MRVYPFKFSIVFEDIANCIYGECDFRNEIESSFLPLGSHALSLSIRSMSVYRLSPYLAGAKTTPTPIGKGAANFIIALLFRSLDFIELVELAS